MQFGFGAGTLYATRNDIANGTPIRFGAMQDISIDFAGEVKELYGQSQYPLDAARGKIKLTGKAKFAQISALIMTNMFFGTTATAGQTLTAYNESATVSAAVTAATSAATAVNGTVLTFTTVPAGVAVGGSVTDTTATAAIPAGTYVVSKTGTTVTLSANIITPGVGSGDSIKFGPSASVANAATFTGDLGVTYANTGVVLTYVASNPSQGQYIEQNGVYSFNVADAAAPVLINYLYTSSTSGFTINGGNPLMGNTPKFQATFNQQYNNQGTTLTLYSCVASKLTFPTKIDDYVIQEFDFMAYANAAGQTFSLSVAT